MAHPVVLMAYDKSPAITKAVAALEEAGLEVVVLNTKTAKLMNFLGALAGEDPEADDDEEVTEEPPVEEPAPGEESAEDLPPEEPEDEPVTEAIVNDEKVIIQVVEGDSITLFPSEVSGGRAGSKANYWINESQFSFWSNKQEGEALKTRGMVTVGESQHYVEFTIAQEPQNPPVLRVGREWLKEALPQGWPVLPAAQAVFDKSKVTPDEVDRELTHGAGKGHVMIIARTVDKYPEPKTSIIMMPGKDHAVGKASAAYHDQTFGKLGTFTVVGILKKDGDEWKLESDKKIPGLETPEQIKKFKAPVYVFK